MTAAAIHNHHSRRSIFRKFVRSTRAPASCVLPGVFPCFMLINCRCRLYQIAPTPLPFRLVRAKRPRIPNGLEIPCPSSNLASKTANKRRTPRKIGASYVPRQNQRPLPDSVGALTCLTLIRSQFVDSFDISQFERRGIDSPKLDFPNQIWDGTISKAQNQQRVPDWDTFFVLTLRKLN